MRPLDNRPLVSVVIPAYNAASTIAETLESVISQTYNPIEVIVADDGSTDQTAEIIKSRFPTVKYCFQENKGVSAARNLGIRNANGSLIAFVDSDDLWLSEKIAEQVDSLLKHPEAAWCYCDCFVFQDSPSNTLYRYSKMFKLHDGDVKRYLLLENFISSPTPIVRREVFDMVGLWNENYQICEDWHMWLKIAAHYKISFCKRPLALYRLLSNSKSHNWHMQECMAVQLIIISDAVSEQPEALECVQCNANANAYLRVGRMSISRGFMTEGRDYLLKAIRLNPIMIFANIFFLIRSFLPEKLHKALIDLRRNRHW
jgi:glycosyltransferase involved in cell wall biosynthesis